MNLSDKQKTKIEALQASYRKEIRPIREKMFDKSVELRRMWLQANPDKDKILALQKEVRTLRDQLEDKAIANNLEIRKVLTPQQREKLVDSGWDRGVGFGPRGGCEDMEKLARESATKSGPPFSTSTKEERLPLLLFYYWENIHTRGIKSIWTKFLNIQCSELS